MSRKNAEPINTKPINYEELDRYLEVMLQLLEGYAEFDEAAETLAQYLEANRGRLPSGYRRMMLELIEEKRRKHRA